MAQGAVAIVARAKAHGCFRLSDQHRFLQKWMTATIAGRLGRRNHWLDTAYATSSPLPDFDVHSLLPPSTTLGPRRRQQVPLLKHPLVPLMAQTGPFLNQIKIKNRPPG